MAACNVRHAHLVRCLFGKTRSRHPCAPNAGMRCGLPASSRQCGRCLGWSSTYAEAADTSQPPNASPIAHHRSGFDRRAAHEFPCSVPALANADDPNMDDQPKTRLICRRCAARMKLARQLPWLDHRLPAILLFSASTAGMSTLIEVWSARRAPREWPSRCCISAAASLVRHSSWQALIFSDRIRCWRDSSGGWFCGRFGCCGGSG